MLHQLLNGNWIELDDIRRIKASRALVHEHNGESVPPRVYAFLVANHGTDFERIDFATIEQAEAYRDELAALVNAAQAAAARPKSWRDDKPML